MCKPLFATCAALLLGASASVCAQSASVQISSVNTGRSKTIESDEQQRARLLGVLVYTNITVEFEQTPVRDALKQLEDALGIPIIGRYSDDAAGYGIDPEVEITLHAVDQPALDVLEELLLQCEIYEACTWQLRRGYVEVSTKSRLAAPAARERRHYHIRDFMLEPARFSTVPEADLSLGPYKQGMIGSVPPQVKIPGGYVRRKAPEAIALEILESVVEVVEPGRWDYGQSPQTLEEELRRARALGGGFSTPVPANAAQQPGQSTKQHITSMTTWATIRLWRDQLIVNAPDFMHRQIGGYPAPIPPREMPAPKRANERTMSTADQPRSDASKSDAANSPASTESMP